MTNRVTWTPEMIKALQQLRANGTAIYDCAYNIGVSYPTAVMKCRELGIADRRNRGRKTGGDVVKEITRYAAWLTMQSPEILDDMRRHFEAQSGDDADARLAQVEAEIASRTVENKIQRRQA